MAATRKYPTIHEQLYALAVLQRREGVPFALFWELAVRPTQTPVVTWRTPEERRPPRCVIWPNDTDDRALERELYADWRVREGWRRAYERLPVRPQDRALPQLAGLLSEDGDGGFYSRERVLSAA